MLKRILAIFIIATFFLTPYAHARDLKVGYMNMRTIFAEYDRIKKYNEELESKDTEIRKEIEGKAEGLRKLRDEMELLSDTAKKERAPEFEKKVRELEEFRRRKVEEFIARKDEMFKQIREDIIKVATVYAKKNGYDMVADEAAFIYFSEKFDLTQEIIKELNK
ncbi:MAG: OmpH family outer membrane protein [Candidatus Omnitrophica bacterium]|nr:OmpH family outer membrane protein [Candidatus Omnitrophota bacterium]